MILGGHEGVCCSKSCPRDSVGVKSGSPPRRSNVSENISEMSGRFVVRFFGLAGSFMASVSGSEGRSASVMVFRTLLHGTRHRCTLVGRAASSCLTQQATSLFTAFMAAWKEGLGVEGSEARASFSWRVFLVEGQPSNSVIEWKKAATSWIALSVSFWTVASGSAGSKGVTVSHHCASGWR